MLILVAALWTIQPAASAQHRSDADLAPIGRLASIGDRSLFVQCAGSGGPLVILEHGLGGSTAEWALVQTAIAPHTTVCAYDRAGQGRSDAALNSPHDAEDAARDLDALLAAIDVDEPVVLVGFSLGGLLARYYASTRDRDVAALVLVDATPPVWTAMNLSGAALEPRIDGLLRMSGIHPRVAEELDILKASEQVFLQDPPDAPVTMLTSGVKSLNPGLAGDNRAALAVRLQNDQARELGASHTVVSGCTHAMPVACTEAVSEAIVSVVDDLRDQSGQSQVAVGAAILGETSRIRRIPFNRT